MFGAALGIGGALLGGIAGSQGRDKSETTTRNLAAASKEETAAGQTAYDNLNQLQDLVNAGPGQEQVANGLSAQNQLAAMLQQYMQSGGVPTQAQTGQANQYAQQAFQGQQNSLNNTFEDQRIASSRNSARMGRSSIDPVLQNKLLQEQSRQQGQLAADQGSFASQYAQQIGQNQLGYANQFAQVQSGLASQAMANRQALLGLGSQLRDSDRNFRAGTATTTTSQAGGGGLAGAITGIIGGAGAGMGAASSFKAFSGDAAQMGGGSSSLSNWFGNLGSGAGGGGGAAVSGGGRGPGNSIMPF